MDVVGKASSLGSDKSSNLRDCIQEERLTADDSRSHRMVPSESLTLQ